jgi:U1 small nuclear ribonucleoprotein 70kDa
MIYVNTMSIDDPTTDAQVRGDPFKTLFIARLSYDIKESDLEREFSRFGPIERVIVLMHILV